MAPSDSDASRPKIPYLKTANEIMVIAWPLFGGEIREGKLGTLGEKLIEYHFTADLPRGQLADLFEPLLTQGQASIDAGIRAEWMELADTDDRMTRGQFRSLLDDFLAEAEERQRRLLGEAPKSRS